MYPWIWIQSVLRELWLPGYTVLIPLRWKLDLAWQRALGSCAPQFGFWSVYGQTGDYPAEEVMCELPTIRSEWH